MPLYEIATLDIPMGAAGKIAPDVAAFAADGAGTLLGCWISEVGLLNRMAILRVFADAAELAGERQRTLESANPFGAGAVLRAMSLDSYAPFPFLPPVETGDFGPVYEIRTYNLKTGGLKPTLAAWEAAVPGRTTLSRLSIALYALEGRPRITHIWPFRSFDERFQVRGESVKQGLWPPKGGPDWLEPDMQSAFYLPTAISPLK